MLHTSMIWHKKHKYLLCENINPICIEKGQMSSTTVKCISLQLQSCAQICGGPLFYYGISYTYYARRVNHIPGGIDEDPEARLDTAVIALQTEQVQFHIPLWPKADCELLNSSKHSKNWYTLQTTNHIIHKA